MLQCIHRIRYSTSNRATFVRFATVGLTISLIDIAGLYILMALGLNVYISRIFSYFASMTSGYLLNRYFTFHHLETGRKLRESLFRHYSVHSLGGILNFALFSVVLIIGQKMGGRASSSATLPLIAVWVGGMGGMFFNYFFSKRLVFNR